MNIETQVKGYADNQPFWKEDFSAQESNSKGDDVKGAFLALLQGLVGYSGVNLSNVQVAPDAKIAQEELVEKEVEKKTDSNKNFNSFDNEQVQSEVAKDSEMSKDQLVKREEDSQNLKTQVQTDTQNENQQNEVVSNQSDVVAKKEAVDVNSEAKVVEVEVQTAAVQQNIESVVEQNAQVVTNAVVKENKIDLKNAPVVEAEAEGEVAAQAQDNSKARAIEHSVHAQQSDNAVNTVVQAASRDEVAQNQVVQKAKVRKQLDIGLEDSSEEFGSVDELLKKYLNEQGFEQAKQTSNSTSKDDYKLLDKSNSVKDNILAKIMFGAEGAAAASAFGQKHISGEAKGGIDTVIGLVNKASTEKATSEKTSGTSFIKKTALSQEFVDKVKEVLEKAAINKTNDSISVKIDPPHLGQIHVKITHKNGEIYAKLTPENKEVEQVLKSKSSELMGVLQALGFAPNEVHVQIGREYTPEVAAQDGLNYYGEGQASSENNNSFENKGFVFQQSRGHNDPMLENFVEQKAPIVDNGWVA